MSQPLRWARPSRSASYRSRASHAAGGGGIVIFVGHRLNEVRRVADRIVVLRNGRLVADLTPEDATEERIVLEMVGRELADHWRGSSPPPGDATPVFESTRASRAEGLGPDRPRVAGG